MRRIFASISVFISALLLIAAIADLMMRYPPAQIAAGQPFIYWLYVDVFDRLPLALAWLVLLGMVATVGRQVHVIRTVPLLAWGVATVAIASFTLVAPLLALTTGSNVRSMTSLTLPDATWHLYLQPSLRQSCDVVLVRCERWCYFVTSFEQPICLGVNAAYALRTDGDMLVVSEGDEDVYRTVIMRQ